MTCLAALGHSQLIPRPGFTTSEQTLPGILAARKGLGLNNYATAGAQSGNVFNNQLPAALANSDNSEFMLCFGVNDLWYNLQSPPTGTAPQTFQNNLINTIQAIKAAGKPLMVFSDFPFWTTDTLQRYPEYLRLMRTAALGNDAEFYDWYTARLDGRPDATNNGWHYPPTGSPARDAWVYGCYAGDIFHPNYDANLAGAGLTPY
ncbi:MAG: SGNH/GDSL hydrolase family protein [Planctomycetaceae bacterium]|nr:SGNH/GDSL hydrolase family protein [Planctomycetaceae bacterium]